MYFNLTLNFKDIQNEKKNKSLKKQTYNVQDE